MTILKTLFSTQPFSETSSNLSMDRFEEVSENGINT